VLIKIAIHIENSMSVAI